MRIPERFKEPLLNFMDSLHALIPRPRPSREKLESCKIISHRGERDGVKVRENTLEAFRAAQNRGAWGIEFDIRWTKDEVPVIHHDATAERVFQSPLAINQVSFNELRKAIPTIPLLEEAVNEFGKKLHLMIEIKNDGQPLTAARQAKLASILKSLTPVEDYHLMGLVFDLLLACEFAPKAACLPVAELNIMDLAEKVHANGFGGLTGHYVVLGKKALSVLNERGIKTGTGFASSKSVLYRELNRGIHWIFTNHAGEMRRHVDRALGR